MFKGGRLEARNEAGELLRWWLADEAMGRPLAGLLNQGSSQNSDRKVR
jgi:hypothetical protein